MNITDEKNTIVDRKTNSESSAELGVSSGII